MTVADAACRVPDFQSTRASACSIARGSWPSGGETAIRRIDRHAQSVQWFDHLDADRAGADIHPLHVEAARGVQRGLDAVADHDKGGVRDVQMRIDAERGGEE